MSKTRSKVEWFSVKDKLPEVKSLVGEVVITMPFPRCMMYGWYEKDGKQVMGFHDDVNGKIKEYKVESWAYFPYND